LLCHGTVCVVGKMRDLILQLSKSSIYSTKPRVVCGDSTHQLKLITKSLIFFPAALTIVRALSLAQ
ncbi:hypothetical protein V9Y69_26290, partial [Klebsiella pneumoniae]